MKSTESSSTSTRSPDRLLVTEHSVHIALASFMLERARSRVGINQFILSLGTSLPRIDVRLRLWKTFLHLAGVNPAELHDDLAIDVGQDHEQRLHAVLTFGAERGFVSVDRSALEAFLITYELVSGVDCHEAEFGPDDGDPTHVDGDIRFSDYQLDRYDRTPLCRIVNAVVRWLADRAADFPFDPSLVGAFASEYAGIFNGALAEVDVDALWQACKARLTLFGDDYVLAAGTRAAANLGDVIAEAGWQLCGYATPEEARHILSV